ncbi:hypothetical protein KCP75_18505 [Salmonella enterica subsp. enterica]|nr:hypothetical protein KCP75_18505 [Salmonella enterica subsp. enterica]
MEFVQRCWEREVTPTVCKSGRIRLKLQHSQNVPGQVLQQADGVKCCEAIDKQEIETQAEVCGETLALRAVFFREK